jgi:hypothetical protein
MHDSQYEWISYLVWFGRILGCPNRVAHSPPFVIKLFRTIFIGWSQVRRRTEQFLFLPENIYWPPLKGGSAPPKSGTLKSLQLYAVGTLNLYIKRPEKTSKTCSWWHLLRNIYCISNERLKNTILNNRFCSFHWKCGTKSNQMKDIYLWLF